METLRFALKLIAELIPLFLIISTGVYLAVERITPARIRALLAGRSRWIGVPLAGALGALTPFCSCSTVPLVNGMRQAGIPVAMLMAFLIASPLINPVAVAMLWSAIGPSYAVLYTVTALAAAIGGGVAVAAWYGEAVSDAEVPRPRAQSPALALAPAAALRVGAPVSAGSGPLPLPLALAAAGPGACPGACPAGAPSLRRPLVLSVLPAVGGTRLAGDVRSAFGRALGDLRRLWPALVVAVAAGAAIHGYVPADLLARLAGPDAPWAIPVAAVLGLPVYASVVVMVPLAASLVAKGVSAGAVTAFLMGASGFSVPEGILLSRILPAGLLVRALVVFALSVMAIGYLFMWVA
jgi:uncharacterized protein